MTAQASKTDPVATLKHNGGEGRMALTACSWSCLTSLSEATRSKLQHDCPGFQNGIFRHTEIPWQWRVDDACSLQPVVPNVAFWSYKTAWLPRLPSGPPRHTETPWQWRTDGACSLRLPKRTPAPHWNTMAVKGSEGRMAPAACMRSCLTSLPESTRNWLQHDCPGSKILLN